MPDGDGERDREEPPRPQSGEGSSGLSRRSGVWLTTLSTVVAVATGMFTLRDQIFPVDAGNAQASRAPYEQSVGHLCNAGNAAQRTALPGTGLTRDAGLTRLGGGHCALDPPIVTPRITLRRPARLVVPSSGPGSDGGG
jgi:hypothetical protein